MSRTRPRPGGTCPLPRQAGPGARNHNLDAKIQPAPDLGTNRAREAKLSPSGD